MKSSNEIGHKTAIDNSEKKTVKRQDKMEGVLGGQNMYEEHTNQQNQDLNKFI